MRIAALFTDYDGTLAPDDVPREDSKVPEPILSKLVEISSRIPVGIVTSKDLAFVKPRTPFARAWACVMGLEVRLADGRGYVVKGGLGAYDALAAIDKTLPRGVIVERKFGSNGALLGFSLDWSARTHLPDIQVAMLIEGLTRAGLFAQHTPGYTFIDAFVAPPGKAPALDALLRLLEIDGPFIYLGDSPADNEAFERSDISIGVRHPKSTGQLHSKFMIDHRELAPFLSRLVENDLEFSRDLLVDDSVSG